MQGNPGQLHVELIGIFFGFTNKCLETCKLKKNMLY